MGMPYIYLVQMDIPSEHEAEFNRIYDEEHVPMIVRVPGCRSCTRYKLAHSAQADTAKYLAIYEMDSADVPKSAAWIAASDTGLWKPNIRPHTTNRRHGVFERIAGPVAKPV
jgi:hypothetical protein